MTAGQGNEGEHEERRAGEKPPTEALARAERAFAAGNYAEVRRLCRPLFAATSPEVSEAARRLHRRVSVDPVQIAVILGCLGLLAWIVARYVA